MFIIYCTRFYVLLYKWFWHKMTHNGWLAVKSINQSNISNIDRATDSMLNL